MKDCGHKEFYYYPAPNEAGWKCVDCGQKMPGDPAGYRPDLDRKEIRLKAGGLLNDLHNANLIYISNGSHGDHIEAKVADRCRREGRFDQYSILLLILEELTPSHAEYWKRVGDGVVSGNDPRSRCDEEGCGKLADSYGARKTCMEHVDWARIF